MSTGHHHGQLEISSQRLLDEAEANTLRVLEVYCDIMQEMRCDLDNNRSEFSA